MAVRYKGNVILFTKGMSRDDVMNAIKKRMDKRATELEKRKWIYDEYNSLKAKQDEDAIWLAWCEKNLTTSVDERKEEK